MRRVALLTLAACSSREPPAPAAASGAPSAPAPSASVAAREAADAVALAVAGDLAAGRFEAVTKRFDATLTEKLSEATIEAVWKATAKGLGDPRPCVLGERSAAAGQERFQVRCPYAKVDLVVSVGVDAQGKVSALYVKKAGRPDPNPPAYADPAKYEEEAFEVSGGGATALPGTLTLPKDRSKPVPAVVLVHGSGPNDRDESAGGARPFRDLALGLASRGIAVLRYEKRTWGPHARSLEKLGEALTFEEETVADAVAAMKLLAARKDVSAVFVAGHSLGGMAAPRILEKAGKDGRGMISLAGSVRPLEDLVVDQTVYLSEKQGKGGLELLAIKMAVSAQARRVKEPGLSASTPKGDLPLGLPAAYWLALRGYDPPAVAKKLGKPALILQGGRDYQVTKADFDLWKKGLAGSAKASFQLFDDLNHLLVSGTGPSVPEEYDEPAHVAEPVVKAVAEFVKKSAP